MTTPFASPIHLQASTGDNECCNKWTCCLGVKDNGSIQLSSFEQRSEKPKESTSKAHLEDEDPQDFITRSFVHDRENAPSENILKQFMLLGKNTKKGSLVTANEIKKIAPKDKKETIEQYYSNNAKAYQPTTWAFLAAHKRIDFSKMYDEASGLPASIDEDMQQAIIEVKPIWKSVKEIINLVKNIPESKPIEESKQVELEDDLPNIKKLSINTKATDLLLELAPKITTLDERALRNFQLQSKTFELISQKNAHFNIEGYSNFTPFSTKDVRGIMKIAKVIDTIWTQEKYQKFELALEHALKLDTNKLLEMTINDK